MDFVVDCSIVGAMFLPDENDKKAIQVLNALEKRKAVAPALFHWEINNVLYVAYKRKRCSSEDVRDMIGMLAKLPIELDVVPDVYEMNELFALCDKYKLSAYDAAYLRTAKRYNVPLMTLDKALQNAAKKESIRVSLQ